MAAQPSMPRRVSDSIPSFSIFRKKAPKPASALLQPAAGASSGIALQLEYSVDVEVSLEFAWKYRTDITNWKDPPAEFVLDGPFISGSCGTTLLPGQQPLHWSIREVRPLQVFVLEMQLDKALLTFEWRFDALSEQRTRMTQKIVLSGDNAAVFADQVEAGFSPGLAAGMRRIATEMAAAVAIQGRTPNST
jgi:hypothetical protein